MGGKAKMGKKEPAFSKTGLLTCRFCGRFTGFERGEGSFLISLQAFSEPLISK